MNDPLEESRAPVSRQGRERPVRNFSSGVAVQPLHDQCLGCFKWIGSAGSHFGKTFGAGFCVNARFLQPDIFYVAFWLSFVCNEYDALQYLVILLSLLDE